MNRILTALTAALTAIVMVFALSAPSYAADETPVLLSGDSITMGYQLNTYTYRWFLDNEINRQGNPIDLVGSRCDVRLGSCSDYKNNNFDRQHFAKSGTTYGLEHPKIDDEIRAQNPDIVYVLLGINDLRGDGANGNTVKNRMVEWINSARSADPDIELIIAQVMPAGANDPGRNATLNQRVSDFNTLGRQTAESMSTARSPITWSTLGGFYASEQTVDGLHPNEYGERWLAQRAANSLKQVGALPFTPATIWSRP